MIRVLISATPRLLLELSELSSTIFSYRTPVTVFVNTQRQDVPYEKSTTRLFH
jgi:hypothetical protein